MSLYLLEAPSLDPKVEFRGYEPGLELGQPLLRSLVVVLPLRID